MDIHKTSGDVINITIAKSIIKFSSEEYRVVINAFKLDLISRLCFVFTEIEASL